MSGDHSSAAKIHVLGLAPLSRRLGEKWPRLSSLVHQLFETALEREQGPSDHFISLDELSYVVTFHDLSPAEANLACTAIAKTVCQKLFGDQIDEVAVRSLVSEITTPKEGIAALDGKLIEQLLEKFGTETVISKSRYSGSPDPVVLHTGNPQPPRLPWTQQIRKSQDLISKLGLKLGFFPVWELRKRTSSSLYLAPFSGNAAQMQTRGIRALDGIGDKEISDIEIDLLNAAAAYAMRIGETGQVAAVGVGISYDTISQFHTRMRYLSALQKIPAQASSPILLKIERIPSGAPIARIAELAAMMRFPSIRITAEFKELNTLPEMDIRIGAIGLGGVIPQDADHALALHIMKKLARRAADQKAFAFLDRLDSAELVNSAVQNNIRFGSGNALGTKHFSGLEVVPGLPLVARPAD